MLDNCSYPTPSLHAIRPTDREFDEAQPESHQIEVDLGGGTVVSVDRKTARQLLDTWDIRKSTDEEVIRTLSVTPGPESFYG